MQQFVPPDEWKMITPSANNFPPKFLDHKYTGKQILQNNNHKQKDVCSEIWWNRGYES